LNGQTDLGIGPAERKSIPECPEAAHHSKTVELIGVGTKPQSDMLVEQGQNVPGEM
jgi:hypothetical protein